MQPSRGQGSKDRAPSAGDHPYREILVRVYPQAEGAITSVHLRHRRGSAVLHDRRLTTIRLPAGASRAVATSAGVLRAAAAALLEAADRLDNL